MAIRADRARRAARTPGDRGRDVLARRPAWRAARGLTLGLISVGLSSAAHAAAGGHVDPVVLLLAAVVAGAGFTALSDREWRLPRLAGALVAGQALLHLVLLAASPHAPAGPASHAVGTATLPEAMGYAPTPALAPGVPAAHLPSGLSGADHGGLGMLLAHVAALMVIAALLRGGEDVLLRAACALAAPLVGLVALRPEPVRPRRLVLPAGRPCGGCRPLLLQHSLGRRGPPEPLAC